VAKRLSETVRPTDMVARIGGDEFLVALDDVSSVAKASEVADRIRRSFAAPFDVEDGEIYASMSAGLVVVPGDTGMTPEVLIRNADTAMYQAKDAGRDGVMIFDDSMRDRVAERVMLERELRRATERGELELYFQPLVDLRAGPAVGLETLLRWRHPRYGLIPPSKFIPVAEDSGLIVEIGAWVLTEALRHTVQWRAEVEGAEDIHVAVNLSVRQLREPGLVDMVGRAIEHSGLPGSAVVLEITESVMMDDPDMSARLLGELRDMGVGLAIDDFGTGYSSLAYLERFPVDCVKIDQAFVAGLDRKDGSSDGLVAAIVAMARALGLTTVAEGIETERQERRLEVLGCDVAQGFLYARPMPSAEVPAALIRLQGPQQRTARIVI
jgi:diguanylate cyclase